MSKDSHLEPNTDLQDLKLLISRIWVSFESKHEPVKSPILNVSFTKFTPNPTQKTQFGWTQTSIRDFWKFLQIFENFKKLGIRFEFSLGLAKKTILSSKIPNECSKAKNSYHRPENVFLDFYKSPFPAWNIVLFTSPTTSSVFLAWLKSFFRLTIRPCWKNRTGRRWCE